MNRISPSRDAWIISLGRWGGVPVGVHIFFVLFAVFTGYLAWLQREQDAGLLWLAGLSVGMLFLSVLAHECGHLFAARRLGGHLDAMVLGPLGGLRPVRVPEDPQGELLAVLAGPLTTLGICLSCLVVTSILEPTTPSQLLNPLAPEILGGRTSEVGVWQIVRLACWINWWLFVVNLIPAFPFDGGRACVTLLQATRPKLDRANAIRMVAGLARIVAVAFFVLAFVFHDALPGSAVPTWLAFLLLSVFVYFAARFEEIQRESDDEDEELFGYDFSQGYTSLEKHGETPNASAKPGPITRWLQQRRERERLRLAAIAAEEDRRADEILARLHQHGMDSLSADERAILRRVSERLRAREKG